MGIKLEKKFQIEHKLKTAKDFEVQGKPLHAVQIYKTLIDEHPHLTEAYFSLAELYQQLGNIEPAVEMLEALVESEPENMEHRLFLGQYFLKAQKWEDAIETLSYILPDEEPLVSFFLGYSHFMLKDYELSRLKFLSFVGYRDQPELVYEAYLYLSKIEIEMKNFEAALKYAKKTEGIYSNHWELNLIYAKCFYNLGMHAHGISSIEKAVRLNPKEPSVFEWAGKVYLKHGDYLKAEKSFLKFIEWEEEISSEAYSNLAEACLKISKAEEALAYFTTALKIDPNNKFAAEGKKNVSKLLKNNVATDG